MNVIEAGKICRDSGFNWGRGSWWGIENNLDSTSAERDDVETELLGSPFCWIPNIAKGATRGVILEWAREKTGNNWIFVSPCYHGASKMWRFCSLENFNHDWSGYFETEIECYAKLCQWVKENSK